MCGKTDPYHRLATMHPRGSRETAVGPEGTVR